MKKERRKTKLTSKKIALLTPGGATPEQATKHLKIFNKNFCGAVAGGGNFFTY
ncbi:hypothetical protein JW756_05985 [Candidatus Woesearchaeota archaeon]|nr:hypothetical protein [Candidatus Woesearchaeota archaeon]